jgi:hypothetical protein
MGHVTDAIRGFPPLNGTFLGAGPPAPSWYQWCRNNPAIHHDLTGSTCIAGPPR